MGDRTAKELKEWMMRAYDQGLYTNKQLAEAIDDLGAAYAEEAVRSMAMADELQPSTEMVPIGELVALRRCAARYRWLREQDWFEGPLCVLRDPKRVLTQGIGLGADCPSHERLDAAIDDHIRSRSEEAKHG